MLEYGLTTKDRFPSEKEEVQNWREGTTFYADFLVAEAFLKYEPNSLNDTWNRAWKSWKNNVKYVVELCLSMNHLCWEHNQDNSDLCSWYGDKYYLCKDRIFSDGSEEEPLPEGCINFSDADKQMAFNVLD